MFQKQSSTPHILGGGTKPSRSKRLSCALPMRSERYFECSLQEVTLEADPETITPAKAESWRDSGFDRISMGVQSFVDTELKAAGRMHCGARTFTTQRGSFAMLRLPNNQFRFNRGIAVSDR